MIVSLDIKNDVLTALLARSRDTGSSVEDVMDELLREALEQPQIESIDIAEILAESLASVRKMNPDTEFTLEDVVSKESWMAMSTGDRKSFGKLFRKETENSELAEWMRRSSGNKAIYRAL
ncbi:DUF1413 domain-containing protein [Pseudomonas sp. SWRI81]|uniref:DUF1413 domain-containing protein n=1 Tax=Pseudomonas sp. SWRI81 TaxID=2745505 RepID=UPI0016457BFE|nr:DUF1413 domain-containing protein [Pseudomonas sp. SWRI81]MBC3271917.1 DUF1413 domain-containing protein [Pseudomonas sp. SWRI81]